MAPDSDADLRARVAELEQRVAAQQETISQLLPGRRGVLKGAALLGGGALVGAGTADRASAQASGQVGTSSDPVDVEAYDLAVQNQLSSNVDAGGNDLTNVGSLKTDNLTTNGQSGVELPQDVTSSRSLGTWETNNTGNAIFVMIQLNVKDQDTDVNDRLRVATDVNSSQTANPVVDTQIQTSDGSRIDLTVTAMVPDGAEYRARIVKDDSNNASLGLWHEQKIGV